MNPSSPAVDIEGYLYKKEGLAGFQTWQRRWATLCDYCLYLYDHHGERESRFAFLLPSVTVERCRGDADFPQLIKLQEKGKKPVLLAASNQVEFAEWFSALSAASCLKRVTSEDSPQDFRPALGNEVISNSSPKAMRGSRPDGYLVRDEDLYAAQQRRGAPRPAHHGFDLRGSQGPYREMSPDDVIAKREQQRALHAAPRRTDAEDPSGGFIRSPHAVPRNPIETVKEDPGMTDADILATRPLEEIKMKYPVSGLAKRMSIAASDLLGKSHDELLISLIQLNREKANLESVRTYLLLVLDHLHEEQASGMLNRPEAEIQERIRQTIHELSDVEHQIEISLPLITFIDNIVKMGAMYAGNDVMFATEYRRHLLSPQQYCPAKPNIAFARKVQEQQVSRALAGRAPGTTSGSGIYDLLHEGGHSALGESAGYRQTREALERELGELQTIYSTFLGKRNELSAYMKELPVNGGLVPEADPTGSSTHRRQRRKSGGDADASQDTTLGFPRRSTSRQPRSDFTNSLRRRKSFGGSNDTATRLSGSSIRLDSARGRSKERYEPPTSSRSHSLPLRAAKERSAAAPTYPPSVQHRLEAEHSRQNFAEPFNGDRSAPITASAARRQLAPAPVPAVRRSFELRASQEEDVRPRSSLQNQLDVLIGRPRLSSGSDHGSRRHLESMERPLVQLTASRYADGPSSAVKLSNSSLDLRQRSMDRRGVRTEADAGPPRQLPGLFVDEEFADPTYERLSAAVTPRESSRVNGDVRLRRRRSSDQRLEQRRESESTNLFDDETIDRAIFTPSKVNIRERYDPNSEAESEALDEEERRARLQRAKGIQRMLASHSLPCLQEWTEQEIGSHRSAIDRRQIEAEKHRREEILELRRSLAEQVKRKSKAAARERELKRIGDFEQRQLVAKS